jgi:HTH-type transcriptional regulator/antitoxin HigA
VFRVVCPFYESLEVKPIKRQPAEVLPPGQFLREEIEARNLSHADLPRMLGWSLRLVKEVIEGQHRITPEIARGLAAVLGTSPVYWLNLEASYQAHRARTGD